MPPGTVPPFITRFDAGSVAVGQLVFSSATHTQGELQDFALNRVRPLFATLPGVSAPPPFGGNQRTIVITLNPDKLQQYQISPDEAIAAVSKATLVMPSGNMWTGKLERIARTNAALGGNLSRADARRTAIRNTARFGGPSAYGGGPGGTPLTFNSVLYGACSSLGGVNWSAGDEKLPVGADESV
jgi:multidrug efflux pump subunit AcrB